MLRRKTGWVENHSRTHVHPCGNAISSTNAEHNNLYHGPCLFSRAGSNTPVSTRTFSCSSFTGTKTTQGVFQIPRAEESMPRNASVALEAGGWIEIPICVTLSDWLPLPAPSGFYYKIIREKWLCLFVILWSSAGTKGQALDWTVTLLSAQLPGTPCLCCPTKTRLGEPILWLLLQLWMKCKTFSFFPKGVLKLGMQLKKNRGKYLF